MRMSFKSDVDVVSLSETRRMQYTRGTDTIMTVTDCGLSFQEVVGLVIISVEVGEQGTVGEVVGVK